MSGLISQCLIIAVIAGIVRSKTHWFGLDKDGENLWLNPEEGILAGSDTPIHFIESREPSPERARTCVRTIRNTTFNVPVRGKNIRLSLHGRNKSSNICPTGRDDSTVHPKILVVVDYETFKLHGQNVDRMVQYLLAFWNGVDLKFRGLVSPKVRLNIAGILIARHNDSLSFISKNKNSSDVVDGEAALKSFAGFMKMLRTRFRSIRYDIAMAMHPYTMRGQVEGSWKIIPYGTADFGGARGKWDPRTSDSAPVAIIQDKGGFHGIINAARQLGRLFGVGFDRNELFCSDSRNIISQTMNEKLFWSDCSLQAFDKFFHSEDARYLFWEPLTRYPLPRLLPGRLLTADEQCTKTIGSKADQSHNQDMCARLRCMNEPLTDLREQVRFPAADGTVCRFRKICLDGKCVYDPEL